MAQTPGRQRGSCPGASPRGRLGSASGTLPVSTAEDLGQSCSAFPHALHCRLASQPAPNVNCPSKGTRTCQLKGGQSYERVAEGRQHF